MLSQRLITAVILASTFLAGIFLLPSEWFVSIILIVALIGAFEWTRLSEIQNRLGQVAFILIFLALSVTLFQFRTFALVIDGFAIVMWIGIVWLLSTHPRYQDRKLLFASLAILSLSFAFFAIADMMLANDNGAWWVLGMFAVIWGADAAAFFTGRRFGKKKLAPRISPGKTVEGVKGSLFVIFAFSLVSGTIVWDNSYSQILLWVLVCLITASFSVVGDLFVSMNKRITGVKDSGRLLPGHGGVLDRIDSTLSAAPVYALCVKVLFI